MKSNPKQPSCKKSAALKKAMVKKDVKSPRNGCDVNDKDFNSDNSGEFGATWSWHKIHLNCRC